MMMITVIINYLLLVVLLVLLSFLLRALQRNPLRKWRIVVVSENGRLFNHLHLYQLLHVWWKYFNPTTHSYKVDKTEFIMDDYPVMLQEE